MKIVDLSATIAQGMPVYPGDEPVSLAPVRTLAADHYNAFRLASGLHAGTHVDMPMHLTDDPRTAARFDVGAFTGKGVLLDVRGEDVIGYRESYARRVFPGSIVLLFTGFDAHFSDASTYFERHPVVSQELAAFLASRRIRMLGMDTPSPDRPPFPVHQRLLSQGIFLLENLTNLGALCGCASFDVAAVPLKIEAEASPVRAYATIHEEPFE